MRIALAAAVMMMFGCIGAEEGAESEPECEPGVESESESEAEAESEAESESESESEGESRPTDPEITAGLIFMGGCLCRTPEALGCPDRNTCISGWVNMAVRVDVDTLSDEEAWCLAAHDTSCEAPLCSAYSIDCSD